MARRGGLLLTAGFALLLFVTGGSSSAGAQSAEDNPADVDAGSVVYESNCAGCHGATGEGSNSGRPLTGIAAQESDRSVHFASIADGKGNMPAFGDRLSDDEIDSAVSFVRLTFVEASDDTGVLAVTGPTHNIWLTGVGLFAIALGAGLIVVPKRRLS